MTHSYEPDYGHRGHPCKVLVQGDLCAQPADHPVHCVCEAGNQLCPVHADGASWVVYSREKLPMPVEQMSRFRKITPTPMFPVFASRRPVLIHTQEGRILQPAGWSGFIAVDKAGHPYPIADAEHEQTYRKISGDVAQQVADVMFEAWGGDDQSQLGYLEVARLLAEQGLLREVGDE